MLFRLGMVPKPNSDVQCWFTSINPWPNDPRWLVQLDNHIEHVQLSGAAILYRPNQIPGAIVNCVGSYVHCSRRCITRYRCRAVYPLISHNFANLHGTMPV